MATKRVMRAFKMNEISAVDRPAQAHAKALIMKRDDMPEIEKFLAPDFAKDMYGVGRFAEIIQSLYYLGQSCEQESENEGDESPVPDALKNWLRDGTKVFRAMADEEVRELIAAVKKRDFSAKERKKDAKSGAAMADGSFPIEGAEDLSNAMRLAGHAKDPAAARRHIKARAKALGLESHLSGAYSKAVIEQASRALAKALDGADDADAIRKEHDEYLDGVLPAEIVKAHRAASGSTAQGANAMTTDTLVEKAKGLKEKHKAYYADLNEQEKEDFLALSEAERDKKVGKDPDEKDQAKTNPKGDKADKRAADDIAKRLDDAVAKAAAQEAIIKGLQEERDIVAFGKRAVTLGLDEKRGETLRKAYQGDAKAIGELETLIKSLTEAARVGKVFEEFGSAGGGAPATAKAEFDAIVAEVAKADRISVAKAFTKVYTDPQHAALKARYDAETSPLAKRR